MQYQTTRLGAVRLVAWVRLGLVACALQLGCGTSRAPGPPAPLEPAELSGVAQLTAFRFEPADNPQLSAAVSGRIDGQAVLLSVPAGTDLSALVPQIDYVGANLEPPSAVARDFRESVRYVVTAQDGTQRTFTASVGFAEAVMLPDPTQTSPASGAAGGAALGPSPEQAGAGAPSPPPESRKAISRFSIAGVSAAISNDTIRLTVPFDTHLHSITPDIVWVGASIAPLPTDPQDFTQPVVYEVTAHDGSSRRYTVVVEVAGNDAKAITHFQVFGIDAVIAGQTITLRLPAGTDLTQLAPTITLSGGTVEPPSEQAQDFSEPVSYTVTGADGSTQRYQVVVMLAASSDNDIQRFEVPGAVTGLRGDEIVLDAPFGTVDCSWAPTIVHTGRSIAPASGEVQDFRQAVTYTVTAADGSRRTYTARCHVPQTSAHGITRFALLGAAASIVGHDITLTLPYGTSLSALVPSITHHGVSVSPPSGVPQNFLRPVRYSVMEADGTQRTYTVTLACAGRAAKELVALTIEGRRAEIVGQQVRLSLPFGSDTSALAPVLVQRGARVIPQSGTLRDLREPVVYGVIARDGTRRDYELRVTVEGAAAKRLAAFALLGVEASVAGEDVRLTLPYGTDLRALVPSRLEHTGASVAPAAELPQDFTQPVGYTVTAADGSTQTYTVYASVDAQDANRLLAFDALGYSAQIVGDELALWLPAGTDLSSIVPSVAISGASVQPLSSLPVDLRDPVDYLVTAVDGGVRRYRVRVQLGAD